MSHLDGRYRGAAWPWWVVGALTAALTACGGENCHGSEGPTLMTACAAWNNGRYERLPDICSLPADVGSTTTSWSDDHGTCTCDVSREFPTNFYDVSNCNYSER